MTATCTPPTNWAIVPAAVAEPRVIRQFTSIFLVSRCGEMWRVYDSNATNGLDRQMPSPVTTAAYRVFRAVARTTDVRTHRFTQGASRDIDSLSLQAQLDESFAD